jgi:hypothetical protein
MRQKFKKGGRVAYDGSDSNVVKEAKEKKTGGAVGKARGGSVGSDKSPFSSAHKGGGGSDKHPFSSAHRR